MTSKIRARAQDPTSGRRHPTCTKQRFPLIIGQVWRSANHLRIDCTPFDGPIPRRHRLLRWRVLVCDSAEAATDFSALVLFLSASTRPALLATRFEVCFLWAIANSPSASSTTYQDSELMGSAFLDCPCQTSGGTLAEPAPAERTVPVADEGEMPIVQLVRMGAQPED